MRQHWASYTFFWNMNPGPAQQPRDQGNAGSLVLLAPHRYPQAPLFRAGLLYLSEIRAGPKACSPSLTAASPWELRTVTAISAPSFLVGAQALGQLLCYSGCCSLPSPTSQGHQNVCAPVWKLKVERALMGFERECCVGGEDRLSPWPS